MAGTTRHDGKISLVVAEKGSGEVSLEEISLQTSGLALAARINQRTGSDTSWNPDDAFLWNVSQQREILLSGTLAESGTSSGDIVVLLNQGEASGCGSEGGCGNSCNTSKPSNPSWESMTVDFL